MQRDHEEYRSRSKPVVDENEDLEDSHDREDDRSDWEDNGDLENDRSDEEYSEQRASWWPW